MSPWCGDKGVGVGKLQNGDVASSKLGHADALLPEEWTELVDQAHLPDFRRFRHDAQLQQLALDLWRDYLERSGLGKEKLGEILDREDLKPADLWAPGLSETITVGSTEDEVRRYRKKLEFRAEVLSGLLRETLGELERSARWRPSDKPNDEDVAQSGG